MARKRRAPPGPGHRLPACAPMTVLQLQAIASVLGVAYTCVCVCQQIAH